MSRSTPLLIQVVPQLKPGRCGVTDHALPLAHELKSVFGIDSVFVVLNSQERCQVPYDVIYCEPEKLFPFCAAQSGGRPAALLVHVSGYGYSADGAPMRLAEELARVRDDGRFPMAAFFHEISATGAPWSAAFWHAARQERAIRKIAELCDLIVTNVTAHAQWLQRETKTRPEARIQLLPVFSTIGEARERTPLAKRDRAIAVFGLPGSRRRAFKELARCSQVLSVLRIQTIVDIGTRSDLPDALHGVPVRHEGELGVDELTAVLAQTAFGYLSYPANYLAKSSIFAAYCAHGAIPVIANPFAGTIDGLEDGVQVLSPKSMDAALAAGLDHCSEQAWQWYRGHGVCIHAQTYAHWLNQAPLAHEHEEVRR
jgi:hypothetical protein